jgi:hypothetical protein
MITLRALCGFLAMRRRSANPANVDPPQRPFKSWHATAKPITLLSLDERVRRLERMQNSTLRVGALRREVRGR